VIFISSESYGIIFKMIMAKRRIIIILVMTLTINVFAFNLTEFATVVVGKSSYTCYRHERYVYVVSRADKKVSVVDLLSGKTKLTITEGMAMPVMAVSDGKRIYVSDSWRNSIIVYDMRGRILTSIRVGIMPGALKLHEGKLYVSSTKYPYIWVVNLKTLRKEKTIRTYSPTPFFGFLKNGDFFYLNYKNYIPGVPRSSDVVAVINGRIYRGDLKGPRVILESRYGTFVAGFYDGKIARLGKTVLNVEARTTLFITCMVEFSGSIIVSSIGDNELHVFEPILMKEYTTVKVKGKVVDMKVLFDHLLILTHDPDRLHVLDEDLKIIATFDAPMYPVAIFAAPTIRKVGVLGADEGILKIFSVKEAG